MLSLSIKSFANPFVNIALTFFDSSFSSILFDVISFSLFTKLAISLLPTKFARFNLEEKIAAVNLLNYGLVIYLS